MPGTTTLILGGGFGGLTAATVLRSLLPEEHRITVVDSEPDFSVGAARTWVMLGRRSAQRISHPRSRLKRRGIEFRRDSATRIDASTREVRLQSGATLRPDYLIIALGADYQMEAVPGLKDTAETFYSLSGATKLRDSLNQFTGGDLLLLIPKAPFKCPPAPYEAAMLLQGDLKRRGIADRAKLTVCTVEGAPMATAGPEIGKVVVDSLRERGIAYQPLKRTKLVNGERKVVQFEDGSEARFDLLIAVPPHVAPAVVRESGLAGPSGWIPADPKNLRLAGGASDRVFAIGDVSSVPLPGRFKPDAPLVLPKAGIFAEVQGRVVASNIAAHILGKEPTETFPGQGFCYIEMGDGHAMRGDGSFFDMPHPTMTHRVPDLTQLEEKLKWADEWPRQHL